MSRWFWSSTKLKRCLQKKLHEFDVLKQTRTIFLQPGWEEKTHAQPHECLIFCYCKPKCIRCWDFNAPLHLLMILDDECLLITVSFNIAQIITWFHWNKITPSFNYNYEYVVNITFYVHCRTLQDWWPDLSRQCKLTDFDECFPTKVNKNYTAINKYSQLSNKLARPSIDATSRWFWYTLHFVSKLEPSFIVNIEIYFTNHNVHSSNKLQFFIQITLWLPNVAEHSPSSSLEVQDTKFHFCVFFQ